MNNFIKKNAKFLLPLCISCISIASLASCMSSNNSQSSTNFSSEESYTRSRTASNDDIGNVDFIFAKDYRSVTIRFISEQDIENLQVRVKHTTSTGFLLDSQIISVGNVYEGQQYIITSILPDNALTEGKVIKSCELNVFGGTVYYSVAPGLYPNY